MNSKIRGKRTKFDSKNDAIRRAQRERERERQYRALLKGGPVLLSTTQAGPGRNFLQLGARLLVEPCRLHLNTFHSRVAASR